MRRKTLIHSHPTARFKRPDPTGREWHNYTLHKYDEANWFKQLKGKTIGTKHGQINHRQLTLMMGDYRVFEEVSNWEPSKKWIGLNLRPTPSNDYHPMRYNIITTHGIITKILLF
jgi:hypothetical protein